MKRRLHAVFIPWRFYLILILLLFVVAGLITRMVELSVVKRDFLQRQGDVRSERIVNSRAFRGMITDRNGFPLAVSTAVYSVWINPKGFANTLSDNKTLGKLLSINPAIIEKSVQQSTNKRRQFMYLKRNISPQIATTIKNLAIPGVFLQEESKRYYPEGEVAAHLIGFTNVDDQGQEGLELAYQSWLSGVMGKNLVVKDRQGRSIANLHTLQEQKRGNDLSLSIDRRIQYVAYRELMEGIQKNIASSGSVVVLDAKTGEVLAMVNLPSFNPNNRLGNKADVYRNRAITDSFEPGSTIKAFSIASALDSGLYNPDTIIDTSPGWMRVDKHLVRDEHNHHKISVAEVLQVSSNVGVTKMVLSLPPQQLWSFLHRIGFGETTGTGFPGEQSGSLVKRATWRPFALATLAFGYGISVTPLQLAQGYSIFANEGIKKPLSLLKVQAAPMGEPVLSAKVANEILLLLESVTTTKGATGGLARVPGYRVAGKTGTALMAGVHGYQKHRYISTFVGIAPVSNPRLVVAVIIQNPQGKYYHASIVAAPIFQKIMQATLRVLNIPPDDEASLQEA